MRTLLLLLAALLALSATAFAQAETAPAPSPVEVPGAVDFIEIPSANIGESQAFYGPLFGWTFEAMLMPDGTEMPGFIFYTMPGGETMGAFSEETAPNGGGPVLYINCEGVTAKLAEIVAAGGTDLTGSMPLPDANWGHIGQFLDPHGNRMGLWSQTP
jgi:predicted enzyme related to lactoylglutathione lyase